MKESKNTQEITNLQLYQEVYQSKPFQNILNSMLESLKLSEKESEEVCTILRKAINASADFFSNYSQEVIEKAEANKGTTVNENIVVLENRQRLNKPEKEKK